MNSKPKLNSEENSKLIVAAREQFKASNGKDQTLMQEAIQRNWGLVIFISKKFQPTLKSLNIPEDDVASEMLDKLYKCILTYDETRVKFSTFAGICLENTVKMVIRKEKNRKQVESLEKLKFTRNDDEMSLIEVLENKQVRPIEENALSSLNSKRIVECLPIIFSKSDYKLIQMRGNNLRQLEIGKKLGISRSYVSRKLVRINNLLNKIMLFEDVRDIDAFNKDKNFSEGQIKENKALYNIARHIYSDRQIDFDMCFSYISYDYRQLGMNKKAEKLFGEKAQYVLKLLAKFEDVNFKYIENKENQGIIHVPHEEENINKKLTRFTQILNLYKTHKIKDFKGCSLRDLIIMSQFNKTLKKPIEDYIQKNKNETSVKHVLAVIKHAEREIEKESLAPNSSVDNIINL